MAEESAVENLSVQARSNSSRNQAVQRLIAAHQEEFNEILLEERKSRGLFGLPGAKPATVKQQLQEAQEKADKMRKVLEDLGIEFDESGSPVVDTI